MNAHSEINIEKPVLQNRKKNKRGRPKGARTTSLSEVRKQATEEKSKIKAELGNKIEGILKSKIRENLLNPGKSGKIR